MSFSKNNPENAQRIHCGLNSVLVLNQPPPGMATQTNHKPKEIIVPHIQNIPSGQGWWTKQIRNLLRLQYSTEDFVDAEKKEAHAPSTGSLTSHENNIERGTGISVYQNPAPVIDSAAVDSRGNGFHPNKQQTLKNNVQHNLSTGFKASEMLRKHLRSSSSESSDSTFSVQQGYQGDRQSKAFQSQLENLPDELNTALFITHIPKDSEPSDIFNEIRCGNVYALHLYPARPPHTTAAAKLVFSTASSAKTFYDKCHYRGGVRIRGQEIDIRYNRYGQLERGGSETRVLHIEGPSNDENMSLEYWDGFFKSFCKFDWDGLGELNCPDPGRKRLEFRFMRVSGQSSMCFAAAMSELRNNQIQDTVVTYGPDPCGE